MTAIRPQCEGKAIASRQAFARIKSVGRAESGAQITRKELRRTFDTEIILCRQLCGGQACVG